ncbi:hypothetical protein SDC9_123942 [bioreactor metagenome]|uniref:Uncharacterized protein n=1 Tax=bioreactor metagenome TaxID=1076179 RepID=A0A645CJ49_9ZZZZ
MNIQRIAQVLGAHHAALNVPAGPALPPGAVPEGLAGLGRLPQREVSGRSFFIVHIHARAFLQILEVLAA